MASFKTSPVFIQRILKWFCKPEFVEEIQGDLEEELHDRDFTSRTAAR